MNRQFARAVVTLLDESFEISVSLPDALTRERLGHGIIMPGDCGAVSRLRALGLATLQVGCNSEKDGPRGGWFLPPTNGDVQEF